MWQPYKTLVFVCFDNVMPVHQRRHGVAEATEWYERVGFERPTCTESGFFAGRSPG